MLFYFKDSSEAKGTRAFFVCMQCNIAPLNAHEKVLNDAFTGAMLKNLSSPF